MEKNKKAIGQLRLIKGIYIPMLFFQRPNAFVTRESCETRLPSIKNFSHFCNKGRINNVSVSGNALLKFY